MERQSQKLVFENIARVQHLDTAEANLTTESLNF